MFIALASVIFLQHYKSKMARYRIKSGSMYDQLAEAYEAASVVGITRHFSKYDRLVHDSGLDSVTSYPPSATRTRRHHVPPSPSFVDSVLFFFCI